jgi:hypothetical protein
MFAIVLVHINIRYKHNKMFEKSNVSPMKKVQLTFTNFSQIYLIKTRVLENLAMKGVYFLTYIPLYS